MASIRQLKKDINVISYDLLTKCYTLKNSNEELSDERFNEVIKKIVYLRNDLITRSNHPEMDGESTNMKEHCRKVSEDLYVLMGVVDEMKN